MKENKIFFVLVSLIALFALTTQSIFAQEGEGVLGAAAPDDRELDIAGQTVDEDDQSSTASSALNFFDEIRKSSLVISGQTEAKMNAPAQDDANPTGNMETKLFAAGNYDEIVGFKVGFIADGAYNGTTSLNVNLDDETYVWADILGPFIDDEVFSLYLKTGYFGFRPSNAAVALQDDYQAYGDELKNKPIGQIQIKVLNMLTFAFAAELAEWNRVSERTHPGMGFGILFDHTFGLANLFGSVNYTARIKDDVTYRADTLAANAGVKLDLGLLDLNLYANFAFNNVINYAVANTGTTNMLFGVEALFANYFTAEFDLTLQSAALVDTQFILELGTKILSEVSPKVFPNTNLYAGIMFASNPSTANVSEINSVFRGLYLGLTHYFIDGNDLDVFLDLSYNFMIPSVTSAGVTSYPSYESKTAGAPDYDPGQARGFYIRLKATFSKELLGADQFISNRLLPALEESGALTRTEVQSMDDE